MYELHEGDCLKVMPRLAPGSVAMVFADLPYGVTRNRWDSCIELTDIWFSFRSLLGKKGWAIFSADFLHAVRLYQSNPKSYRHDLIWHKKGRPSGFLNARRAPMRAHEYILAFAEKQGVYNPQMVLGEAYHRSFHGKKEPSVNYAALRRVAVSNAGSRFPRSVQDFDRIAPGKNIHPTQKPVALLEWLIATYTNPGDTVLDPTMGSGVAGVACARLGRRFIGIEKDGEYFHRASLRIEAAYAQAAKEGAA